jgi:NitT/TauT family transport system ATP-binding protein
MLVDRLSRAGCEVFIDQEIPMGIDWSAEIDRRIAWCDYLVVLISGDSVSSEMVQAEVRRAHRAPNADGRSKILPIRVAYTGPLGYELDSYIGKLQYALWQSATDDANIVAEVLRASAGQSALTRGKLPTLDRGTKPADRPEPKADMRLIRESVDAPGSPLGSDNPFYVPRDADRRVSEFAAGKARTLVIKGPSQTGKSSLLRAVIGLQKPLAGTVETDVAPSELGILFQDDALLPWRTARDNVALGLGFHGMERQAALKEADAWLARLGLAGFEHRFPRHLSGGQRKRVALAQVLALRPKLLLMDEPFASLDAIVRARIIQDVVALVERERIRVLLVTHDLEEALGLSDVVYLLSQGPRARITQSYPVPIPRPRDVVQARLHPAFAPLYERLWNDLSREVSREAAEAA